MLRRSRETSEGSTVTTTVLTTTTEVESGDAGKSQESDAGDNVEIDAHSEGEGVSTGNEDEEIRRALEMAMAMKSNPSFRPASGDSEQQRLIKERTKPHGPFGGLNLPALGILGPGGPLRNIAKHHQRQHSGDPLGDAIADKENDDSDVDKSGSGVASEQPAEESNTTTTDSSGEGTEGSKMTETQEGDPAVDNDVKVESEAPCDGEGGPSEGEDSLLKRGRPVFKVKEQMKTLQEAIRVKKEQAREKLKGALGGAVTPTSEIDYEEDKGSDPTDDRGDLIEPAAPPSDIQVAPVAPASSTRDPTSNDSVATTVRQIASAQISPVGRGEKTELSLGPASEGGTVKGKLLGSDMPMPPSLAPSNSNDDATTKVEGHDTDGHHDNPSSATAYIRANRKGNLGFLANKILVHRSQSDGTASSVDPANTTTTAAPPHDTVPTHASESDLPPVRLSAVIWKLRSGLGKLAVRNPWEKRLVALRGNLLMYYREEAILENDGKSSMELPLEGDEGNLSGGAGNKSDDGRRGHWWEQAQLNLQNAKENLSKNLNFEFAGTPTDPNACRGVMDIGKESASVAATSGHRLSGSPTPFAITVAVKGEQEWKFCFESQPQQMQWLAALTDVVVSQSVNEYNEGIDDDDNDNNGDTPDDEKENKPAVGAIGKRWSLDRYTVSSFQDSFPSQDVGQSTGEESEKPAEEEPEELEKPEDEEEEQQENSEDETTATQPEAERSLDGVVEPEEKPVAVEPPPVVESPSILSMEWWTAPRSFKPSSFGTFFLVMNACLLYSQTAAPAMYKLLLVSGVMNATFWLSLEVEDDGVDGTEPVAAKTATTAVASAGKSSSKPSDVGTKRPFGARVGRKKSVAKVDVVPTILEEPANVPPITTPDIGTTTIRLDELPEANNPAVNSDGHPFVGWRALPGSTFNVRDHGYMSSKKKIPSPTELYRVENVDVLESNGRIENVATRVHLPKVKFDDSGPKTWIAPDVFVISVAIPTEAPRLGRSSTDARGLNIIIYCVMKEETRSVLRMVTACDYDASKQDEDGDDVRSKMTNAVRLWEEWCRRSPTDPKFQARFKFIPSVQNLKEVGLPSWISSYVGKPVLIKRAGVTGFLDDHSTGEMSCAEFGVNLYPFPYLARQATAYLKDNIFKKVLVSFGFVIEGRSNDELPEVVICEAAQLCYPDPELLIDADDFFRGVSPRSREKHDVDDTKTEKKEEMNAADGENEKDSKIDEENEKVSTDDEKNENGPVVNGDDAGVANDEDDRVDK